jgi:hypothetical protein
MKKLLAIVLSVVMILAFTAAAMATNVSFTGDAEFYRNQVASDGSTNDKKFSSEYELYINAKLTDNLTVIDGLDICTSAAGTDAAAHSVSDQALWITYNFGGAKFSLTNDDFQAFASTSYLADPNYYLQSNTSAVLDANLAKNLTMRIAASAEEYGFSQDGSSAVTSGLNGYTYDSSSSTDTAYAAAINYAGDHAGIGVSTIRTGAFDKVGYDVNAFVKISALKAYASYGMAAYSKDGYYGKPNADEILGLNFAPSSIPFVATVEYNFQDDPLNYEKYDKDYSKNPVAFQVSYNIGQYGIYFRRVINDVQGVYFDGNPVNRDRAWVQVNF